MSTIPEMHPELQPLLDLALSFPKAKDLAEERRDWQAYCASLNRPVPPTIAVEDREFEADGLSVPVRIYRPQPLTAKGCVLYFHGGGFVLGDLDTQDTISWGLAEGTGATVVSVAYRLAPENPYPAALDDCYAVLGYVHDHADELAIDARRITVCGDSAGGNLSAAVSLAARDRKGPAIAAQALVYPGLDTDTTRPSYIENADSPLLSRDAMCFYLDAYLGSNLDNPEPYAMPMRAADLSGLPPALVHTAELDPLHDEGAAYAKRLAAAGNSVNYRCAARMPHGFFRARFLGPAPRAEFDAICSFLRGYL